MTIRISWGTAIALVYAAFATSTLAMVVFAVAHPVDLVSADYYARSERYDQQFAAVSRAEALGSSVSIHVDALRQEVRVSLPATDARVATGTIQLYRASSADLDRTWPLALDDSATQRIPIAALSSGTWQVRLRWQVGDQTFFREQTVRLP
jgi:hypothetical protein